MKIQVELEDVSAVKKRLLVSIPEEKAGAEFGRILADYRKVARLPGFRAGKAPLPLVKRHYRKEIEGDLYSALVPKAYETAVEEQRLSPVGEPRLDELNYSEKGPLSFTALVEVVPSFDLPTYRELEVEAPKGEVGPTDLNEQLERLREQNSNLVSIEDRGAEDGDYAIVDLTWHYQDAEGEATSDETDEADVVVKVGAEQTHAAFTRALIGMKPGDGEDFVVDYAADYAESRFAGKSVAYSLRLKSLKYRELPDLDDDFAKDLGEFDSLEELKSRIGEQLEENSRKRRESEIRNRLFDKVVSTAGFEVPEALVEERIDQRIREVAYNMVGQGVDPTKVNLDWGKLRQDLASPAEDDVRFSLILSRIAEAEKLEVEEAEIDEELKAIAEGRGESFEKVKRHYQKEDDFESLREHISRQKAFDLIFESARVSEEK